jgi:glycerol-3-phosphate acyltransferase PlsX
MRIALDVLGGDYAPGVTIAGAVDAAKAFGHEIILVGPQSTIEEELRKYKTANLLLTIHHASEVVAMDESPVQAVRQKKDSSIVVATQLVAEGKADGFISAGNSGATMAAALLYLKRLPGVARPAITTIFPTIIGKTIIIDVGANVDCKPKHLLQFGVMGKVLFEKMFAVSNAKIGLLSIGEEDSKGNELSIAAFDLLKKTSLNFIGNIEGRDIPKGTADVVVCDGFVGNIVLKFGEGLASMMLKLIKNGIKSHPITWISLPFLWPVLNDLRKKVDYTEYGGAPLLGVNGACIISHGGSNAKAIKNAINATAKFAKENINKYICEEIAKNGIALDE